MRVCLDRLPTAGLRLSASCGLVKRIWGSAPKLGSVYRHEYARPGPLDPLSKWIVGVAERRVPGPERTAQARPSIASVLSLLGFWPVSEENKSARGQRSRPERQEH